MPSPHARIALYGSGPALDAAAEVLRLAGRNTQHVAKDGDLSAADVVLYEGEAPNCPSRKFRYFRWVKELIWNSDWIP